MRIIAGRWKGRRLKAVRGRRVRPTSDRVREAWMAALGPSLPGARVLDLFAGSGALGLEALSRGAAEVVFVELTRAALRTLEANIQLLDAREGCRVVRGDALAFAERLDGGAFDIALADPPYGQGHAARLLAAYRRVPFAGELWIEHRTGEIPDAAGLRQRRYGDTTLTSLTADP